MTCQFSLGTPVSSTNKTDCQDIAEILLKVVLNTITLTLTTRDPFINVSIPWYPLCHYLMPPSYHYMIPSMSLSYHYMIPSMSLSYHYMIPSMSLSHATLLSLHDTLYVTLLSLHDTLYVTISCHPPIITWYPLCHSPIITWYPLCHYLMPPSYHYMIPSMSLSHATLLSLLTYLCSYRFKVEEFLMFIIRIHTI